jgi:ubiquitin-conjugating enzyme E2 H
VGFGVRILQAIALINTEYVNKYASKDASEDSDKDNDDDDEMSSVGSYESGDEDEAAGNMEDI